MKSLISIILSIIFLPLILLSGCTEISDENGSSTIDVGENFSFSLLNGTIKQLKEYRGKVVILDLWATWCTPCRTQILELRKAYANYSHDELEILSINIDARENSATIQNFLKNTYADNGYELDWIFARELDDLSDYNPEGTIPRLCIFDKDGTLFWDHNGLTYFSKFPEGWPYEKITLKEKIDQIL